MLDLQGNREECTRRAISFCSVVLVLLIGAGCATTPISSQQATPVPEERQFLYRHGGADTAQVLVKRDTGFMGSACATRVYVDGKLAAYVDSGEKVIFHIPAETVIIGAEPHGICGGGLIEAVAQLSPGKQVQFRISIDQTASMGLYRTATP